VDVGPVDDSGVHSLDGDAKLVSLSALVYGRKRSRVSSKISDPIASIALAYLSLLIRDSETKNSANMRTRSESVAAVASRLAKALCRSIELKAKRWAGES
jgi:hypothetical protein